MDLSVCIVNFNAKIYLAKCINSLSKGIGSFDYEIIIVDNNSKDGSKTYINNLKSNKIILIKNNYNLGYTIAINQALEKSIGKNILILNPDTILEDKSIYNLVKYLKKNTEVGIVGPKVVDQNGLFQASCRRGLATPFAVFSYFLGLAKLFPKNTLFTGYQLNHLDENTINEVDGVSGSCMLIRRKVFQDVGYFDERFFAYQEDSDYCIRAKEKDWKIYFNPEMRVMHIGGVGGSNSIPMKAIFEWHFSYYKYYFKHFSRNYSFLFNVFYVLIMALKLFFSLTLFILKS